MLKSLRSKLLAMVALILLLTAVTILYFTHRDVGREVMRIEQNNAVNILDSVFLNIQGVYRGLISDRVMSIEMSKERLKRESGFVLSMLELYMGGHDEVLARNREDQQERFLNWLWDLDLGSTGFFIADNQGNIIFDTQVSLVGLALDDVSDIKGQSLSQVVNRPGAGYEQFVVFSAEGASRDAQQDHRLGYLVFFPGWEWVLGSSVDISYIQAAETARLAELVQGLETQFRQMRIAETGSLMMFDSEGEILIAATAFQDRDSMEEHLSDLAGSGRNRESLIISADGQNIIALTRYFRPLEWYLSALIPEDELSAPAQNLVRSQSVIIGLIFVLGALAAVFFVRQISGPLVILAGQSKEMAVRDITSHEFDARPLQRLVDKYRDEVGELAGSFMHMQQELRKNVLKLVDATAARERYESELNMAREIQMSILPKKFPPFPEIKEFDLYAYLEPAREVGGDLYDYFLLDEDHLCFTVGDVSDKGMPASLYMAITRTLVQSHSGKDKSPAAIMSRVNDDLSRDNTKSMFVTMILGILNIRTGQVRYANAGHNLPIVFKSRGECAFVPGISGPVAGAMEGMNYKELSLDLEPGDGLFIYTDGVTEAMNPQKELFSDEKLLQDVAVLENAGVEEVIQAVRQRVVEFADSAPQSDDITMLMLRYNGR